MEFYKRVKDNPVVRSMTGVFALLAIGITAFIQFPNETTTGVYLLQDIVKNESVSLLLGGLLIISFFYVVFDKVEGDRIKDSCVILMTAGFFIFLTGIIGFTGWINNSVRLDNNPSIAYLGVKTSTDAIADELNKFVDELNPEFIDSQGSNTIRFERMSVTDQEGSFLKALERLKRSNYDIIIVNHYNPFDLFDQKSLNNAINPRSIYLVVGPSVPHLIPKTTTGDILPNVIFLSPPVLDEIVWMVQLIPKGSSVKIVKNNDRIGRWAAGIAKRLLEEKNVSVVSESDVKEIDPQNHKSDQIYLWLDWQNSPPNWLEAEVVVAASIPKLNNTSQSINQTKVSPFLSIRADYSDPLLDNITTAAKTVIEKRFLGTVPRSIDVTTNLKEAIEFLREDHIAYLNLNQRLVHRPKLIYNE